MVQFKEWETPKQPTSKRKGTEGRKPKRGFTKKDVKFMDWIWEYEAVADMLNSLRSPGTQKNYASALHVFFKSADMTPDQLLAMSDLQIYNLVTDYFRYCEDIEKTSRGHTLKFAIRKLLRRQGRNLEIRQEDDIEHYRKKTTDKRHIPTKAEIFKIIDNTKNPRDKAFFLCLFQSGMRIGSLLQLTYGMVKNYLFDESGEPLEQLKVPIPLRVAKRKEPGTIKDGKLSKTIGVYYAYLGIESALLLRDLILWRKHREEWTPENHHILFNSQGWRHEKIKHFEKHWHKSISSARISVIIGRAADYLGIPKEKLWAHLFRSAFQNHVDMETGVPTISQLLMGHTLREGESAGHYGNYADTKVKRDMFMKVNWSRSTVQRVWALEERAKERNNKIRDMEAKIEEYESRDEKLETNIRQMLEDQQKTIKELSEKIEKIEEEQSK